MLDHQRNRTVALALGLVAMAADLLVLFLPIHFRGFGEFGNAFPVDVGGRLTVGFVIRNFTPMVMLTIALIFLWHRQQLVASGAFLATGVMLILWGITAPFYALLRLQPLVLLTLRVLIGAVLLVAAWLSARRPPLPSPP